MKTSVWFLPFIVAKRDWEIKNGDRTTTHPPTPSRAHTNAHFTCTAVSEPSQSHRFTGCRVKEYVIWKHTCSDLHSHLSFTLKENKEKAKRRRVHEVKILHLWRLSLCTVCVCPRWDLSNPCFIISAGFWTLSDLGSRFVPNLDRHISFPSY